MQRCLGRDSGKAGVMMRWKDEPLKPEAQLGDKRTRTVFLIFPLRLREETRWLEFTKVVESYTSEYSSYVTVGKDGSGFPFYRRVWRAFEWAD